MRFLLFSDDDHLRDVAPGVMIAAALAKAAILQDQTTSTCRLPIALFRVEESCGSLLLLLWLEAGS